MRLNLTPKKKNYNRLKSFRYKLHNFLNSGSGYSTIPRTDLLLYDNAITQAGNNICTHKFYIKICLLYKITDIFTGKCIQLFLIID